MMDSFSTQQQVAEGSFSRPSAPLSMPEELERILAVFGRPTVCIPVHYRTKKPVLGQWQEKTSADMHDPAYLEEFGNRNIGILCGANNNGLVSIDADTDEGLEELLRLNPAFSETTLTIGARGGNVWFRLLDEEYPGTTKLLDPNGDDWGEFRSTGGQTVVSGVHPSGCEYQIANDSPPIEISFTEINWPENIDNPWIEDPLDRLIEREGEPFQFGSRGSCTPNQNFFASAFARENVVLWCREEQIFYAFAEDNGVWDSTSHERIRERVLRDVQRAAERQEAPLAKGAKSALKLPFLNNVVELLKGRVERSDPFHSGSNLLHAQNGVLFLSDEGVELLPHSHEHMLRNEHGFSYLAHMPKELDQLSGLAGIGWSRKRVRAFAEKAGLPSLEPLRRKLLGLEREDGPERFLRFLRLNLTEDEILLLQKVFGSILFGGNPCQKILLILGKPGSGKSVILDVLRLIVGAANTVQLRTEHLANRFETARFVGKKLLVGPDVEADFLRRKESNYLKSLVGHDFLSSEGKNNPNDIPFKGDLGVVVTSNHHLRINAGDDLNAWRRRLVVLRFDEPFTGRKIPNLAEKLVDEEGDAIFTWAIEGRAMLERDIKAYGDIVLNDHQRAKVQRIVDDSGSLRLFVETCLEKACGGSFGGLTTNEIVDAYNAFCRQREFEVQPDVVTQKMLPDLMKEIHGVVRVNSLSGSHGKHIRGYKGVGLKEENHGS
jgi:hypothetical protein